MAFETKLVFCFISLLIVCHGAPRSKSKTVPQTVYDQKQTGDYNIQLHLKDFQIIALLADDSIGGLGDYDYNYDYSELTVKPGSTSTTLKPSPDSGEATEKPLLTIKPDSHPYPIILPSSTTKVPIVTPPAEVKPSEKPLLENSDTNEVEKSTPIITIVEKIESSTLIAEKLEESPNTPGKIKVQILESPLTNIGIVPGEELGSSMESLPHGDIMQYRRCTSGFSRDKKGRCRRVRRPGAVSPQLPFGISRLASNLASRFRYASPDSSLSSSSSSESVED